jgi:chemosensory pili system protein ChpA (sensor histidine kinase/response regulator)
MVGATEIGDLAWRVEDLLNKLLEGRVSYSRELGGLTTLAVAALDPLEERLHARPSELDAAGVRAIGAYARTLASGASPDLEELTSVLPESVTASLAPAPVTETGMERPTAEETEVAPAADAAPEPPSMPAAESVQAPGDIDPMLRQLMVGEIQGYVSELEPFIEGLAGGESQSVSRELLRTVHSLTGTLAMAPLGQEAELGKELENFLHDRLNNDRSVTPVAATALRECLDRFLQRLSVLEGGDAEGYPQRDAKLLAELADLPAREDSAAAAAQVTEEAGLQSADIADRPPVEAAEPEEPAPSDAPAPEIEEAEAPAAAASADQEAPEAAAGEGEEVPAPAGAIEVEEGGIISIFLEEAAEVLERVDSLLNTWRDNLSDRKLVQNLQREIHTFKGGARMAELHGLGELSHSMETLLEQIATNRLDATVAAVQALEEGCDSLNVSVEQLLSGRMPETSGALQRFERKSGALYGPQTVDTDQPAEVGELTAPEAPADIVEAEAARTSAAEDRAAESGGPDTPAAPAPEEIHITRKPAARRRRAERQEAAREFREIQERPAPAADDSGAAPQIRVAAELMDKLVNYAGEVSIYRSRLEQQLGTVRFNLKEVDVTAHRLKEQLRKLEMESEAQMTSRYQSASSEGSSEFDPLELDRFSNMQQLSRALAESANDLINLHEMLEDSVRQAETLLTQQSRVSSELQEGLMQTRMTPFGSAAPRLRRIVRSAASETGKQARLQLRMAGSSDQLDRNVLERITAPLEHMLRNAVAHGIETPKERRRANKAEEGSITVTVEAEATEFVIRVDDDGAGIDLEAVRKKAIERGLLDAKEEVGPHRLVNFIRESGFSTAGKVTGLAGRGVGMDVVNSEVKQIGGSLDIDTEPGKGTRFTIRIPFSLAVMQAIAVKVGEQVYQIPLNSVAGVARMTPAEFMALLNADDPSYEFAGEIFPLLELERLLNAPPLPLDSDNVSLLMIRGGDFNGAFRVSGVHGQQEVVIKPVGALVSSIPGILGGSIAADGQVQLILDMGPMIRRGLEESELPAPLVQEAPVQSRQPLVMVVDDSITMRKVTSRVLENHSIEVMTAQDGVDAIEKLNDRVPDMMLLDIEMPRMDGYELLAHVRADARLRHVPIVMVTSRAGQKHRKKARKAGANAYLTKPYQEAELVEQISQTLDMELVPRRAD